LETIKKHSLHISLKTISSIVKDAEKQGYIQKQKSVSDTRNKNISPTNQTINEFDTWSKNLKCNINKLVK
jgi:DNA-binding MarR family transcriptional regulator